MVFDTEEHLAAIGAYFKITELNCVRIRPRAIIIQCNQLYPLFLCLRENAALNNIFKGITPSEVFINHQLF